MNEGSNQPQGPGNRKQRRRKRNFGHHGQNAQGQQGRQGGGQNRNNRQNRGQRRNAAFVGPMDHSYRNQNGGQGNRFHNGLQGTDHLEPLPAREDAPTRIFCLIDDLFFLAKIQETARKMNVKVEFVKTDKDLLERMKQNGEEKPSLIIFDLNNANAKPLTLIPKLKSRLKKGTSIIGFLSHVQGDLKQKAHEVGCDMVLPRSAFSQNLPQLLRRHGAAEEEAGVQ